MLTEFDVHSIPPTTYSMSYLYVDDLKESQYADNFSKIPTDLELGICKEFTLSSFFLVWAPSGQVPVAVR